MALNWQNKKWELDEYYKEHLKQLGLMGDEPTDGQEFIAYD